MLNIRPQEALPSTTEPNSRGREQVNVVILRNGRQLEEPNEKSATNVVGTDKGNVTTEATCDCAKPNFKNFKGKLRNW